MDYLAIKNAYLGVSFPKLADVNLLRRVISTCPITITLAEHARQLLQRGLDSTSHKGKKK
jgi:hypothetical protein